MADILKKIFGKEGFIIWVQRLFATIPVVVTAVIFVISAIGTIINKQLDKKLEPVNSYITGKIIQDVEKQFYKIVNSPNDVKPMDLVYVIQDYCSLEQKYKNPIADDRIEKIRDYYSALNKL